MSTSVELLASRKTWTAPEAKPLSEAVWHAWVAKGRAQDHRSRATYIRIVKCIAIAGLLGAGVFWLQLAPFEAVVRFTLTAGAIVVMVQAAQARQITLAAVFGGLAVLYNPLAPVFHLAGDWQRAVIVATAIPFIASLAWPNHSVDPQLPSGAHV